MIPFCNYKNIVRLFVALILFGGISSVTLAEEEYCPPELCDEVLVEVAQEDEYCPPELCDEVLVEAVQEDEYCPPELCDELADDVASDDGGYVEEVEEERPPVDRTQYSRLTGAMRSTMYQHVTTDESIEAIEQWISDGRKNDAVFTDVVMPIMEDDCANCHSTSSTMSKGIQDLPLRNYEQIVAFTNFLPPNSACLACHGNERLADHEDTTLASIFRDESLKAGSAHNELPCASCHYDLHEEQTVDVQQNDYCLDSSAFNNYIASWNANATLSCAPLKEPVCINCHQDEGELVAQSTHFEKEGEISSLLNVFGKPLAAPECSDCHTSHDVVISTQDKSSLEVIDGCGNCHLSSAKTYYESYHGKAALLGSEETAKCFDCHGSHEIVPLSFETSPVSKSNVQETCAGCHEETNENFSSFIPHADYHDEENYPILFYTFWAMNGLLFFVFLFFGVHTSLWLYRSIKERKERKRAGEDKVNPDEQHVRRFNVSHTLLHLMIITSFLTLALTGMTLKFSDNTMFQWISDVLGGPSVLGQWHRIAAMVTGAYFVLHLMQLVILFAKGKITVRGLFKEDYTMIPLMRDIQDMKANMLYFVGKGPKPSFGRWTYWEKFDYMAVFWGVAVIGLSGLILWFPEIVTRYVPGWVINVSYIIHGEEALLATIFIFVAHFFHTHLRPESMPLDPVVFTQRMPLSKFKEERPLEYQSLVDKNELEGRLLPPPTKWYMALVYLFGFSFVAIGIFIVLAIFYSIIFLK
jgi:cytochrome b subunit of formate dehydrogenase